MSDTPSSTKDESREVRVPVQERSRIKMDKVLDAAHTLFLELGFEAVGLRDIAKKAGVSIGTVYAYFADKRELFFRVIEIRGERVFREIKEYSPAVDNPNVGIERIIYDIICSIKKIIKRHQVFFRDIVILSLTDEAFRIAYAPLQRSVANMTVTFLFDRFDHLIEVNDREATQFVIQNAVYEIIQYLVFYDVDIEEERIINELSRMITLYLIRPE